MKLGLGTGKLILSHPDGWACSKEAEIDFEVDISPGGAKKSIVINFSNVFNTVGELIKGFNVDGIFKYDNGTKVAFNGTLEGLKRIKVNGNVHNNFETILKNISQWQEQFKEN